MAIDLSKHIEVRNRSGRLADPGAVLPCAIAAVDSDLASRSLLVLGGTRYARSWSGQRAAAFLLEREPAPTTR